MKHYKIATTMKAKNQMEVDNFFKDLKENKEVIAIAEYHKRTIEEVVQKLQKYCIISYYRSGAIKEIKYDFKETESNIQLKVSNKF